MISSILVACSSDKIATCWEIALKQADYMSHHCHTTLPDVLALAAIVQPNLLLVEATFDSNRGFDVARQVMMAHPTLRCVVLMPPNPLFQAQAILTNVSGYLPDPLTDITELLRCFKAISEGWRYISPALHYAPVQPDPAVLEIIAALSVRQKEILHLLARSMTARQIALDLGIAEPTVNWHKENLWHILGLKGANELKSFAGFILPYL